jgi:3-keto-disaccharide hydrolase
MRYKLTLIFVLTCFQYIRAQRIHVDKSSIVLSAIKGTSSKPDTLALSIEKGAVSISARITGEKSSYFKLIYFPEKISESKNEHLVLTFEPPVDYEGIAQATLQIRRNGPAIPISGLSTKGLEGENEAPLQTITRALGYSIDVGWTSLPNHLRPDLQGEELAPALFKKAAEGNVDMIPVARYSPDFLLNFGYYTSSPHGPVRHQAGILAKAGTYPEHQTLFPGLAEGKMSFDPGTSTFGFYATGPSHTVYSEDIWNILFHPTHASHAMRIYPVKDKAGTVLPDTYLVAMEEAANGDYNDYVFLVKNITPVFLSGRFEPLLNGRDFQGWYTWLQTRGKGKDPERIFTMEAGGIVHDLGKELGYLMTERSFGNFHFTLEFKWGEKKWPPRENAKRDSGICYNIPDDEEDQIWPQSVECQIQEGDVGDFWLLGFSTIQVDGKQNPPSLHSQIVKERDAEKPNGEWNTVEVISFNGKCVHIVNGVVVNYGENASVIGGKILLQSEYSEIYYRNVKIREL